jgi:hypothetical protein
MDPDRCCRGLRLPLLRSARESTSLQNDEIESSKFSKDIYQYLASGIGGRTLYDCSSYGLIVEELMFSRSARMRLVRFRCTSKALLFGTLGWA